MTGWQHGPLALFDVESTGVDPHRDRIVTAAIIETTPGQGRPYRSSLWMLNPGIPIPEGATAVHGITTARAQEDGADPSGAVCEIAQHLVRLSHRGVPIIGHNVRYDLTMLRAECLRHCPDLAPAVAALAPVVDTMVLDKQVDRYRKGSRRLTDVARHYGLTVDDANAHGAEYDALLAGRIAWCLAHRNPRVATLPPFELHSSQVAWAREMAESFATYLLKKGEPADGVAREWPVDPPPDGWSVDDLPAASVGAVA